MYESLKDLKIKTFMLFNLVFAKNISCFFIFSSFFYFLLPAVVAQIFNPNPKFIIPTGIPTKEAENAETEVHSVILESKINTI